MNAREDLTVRVVIPAAGRGSRSNMSLPKTLRLIDGVPILVRILRAVHPFDPCPVVIVSPAGQPHISAAIAEAGLDAELVVQEQPLGMGDAIRRVDRVPGFASIDVLIVVWGDMMSVDPTLIGRCLETLLDDGAAMVFPTCLASPPYTLVVRDAEGHVRSLLERRESTEAFPSEGERDVGIFLFRKDPVFRFLTNPSPKLRGSATNEIGFLPIVSLLVEAGFRVLALPIADPIAASSFNSPSDLDHYHQAKVELDLGDSRR